MLTIITFMGAYSVIFGCILTGIGIFLKRKGRQSEGKYSRSVTGVITGTDHFRNESKYNGGGSKKIHVTVRAGKSTEDNRRRDRIHLIYKYEVDGVEYEKMSTTPYEPGDLGHQIGAPVEVRYNHYDPNLSTITVLKGVMVTGKWFFVIGIVLMAAGVITSGSCIIQALF